MPKITKRVVDAAGPDQSGKRLILWDSEIKGFGLLVLPTGVKSYFYRYRTPEGVSKRATIGKHGTFTAEEVREAALNMRQRVKAGKDPLRDRHALRDALTVGELLDTYVASEKFKIKAASTRSIDLGRIERHLRPLLGKRQVHTLTANDVEKALADIREGKTARNIKTGERGLARVRGGSGAAKMSIDLLKSIFSWAMRERIITSNPGQLVNTGLSGVREAIIENADGYKRLFDTLAVMENELAIRRPVADAIRVVALTGARRGEIASLKWKYVDLKKGLIELPPAAHKTGTRTGKSRIIGLPNAAQAIIARQAKGKGDAYVFKPSKGEGALSLSKPWRAIRTRAGFSDDLGLHSLRHSLASHMAMNGAGAAEIMTALGHRQLSTAQRYVHWVQDERQALAERAAKTVSAGLSVVETASSEPFPKKVKR